MKTNKQKPGHVATAADRAKDPYLSADSIVYETTETEPAKHTPGPWHTPGEVFTPMNYGTPRSEFHKPAEYKAIGIGNRACHVGYASLSECVREGEAKANAALIAAAPDLLAACKTLLAIVRIQNGNLHEDTNKAQAVAEAAISAAEGRGE